MRYLLEEAASDLKAYWVIADGADAARMARSIPVQKLFDDAIIALYQNGEPFAQRTATLCGCSYPDGKATPRSSGCKSVVTDQPAYSKDETFKYTDRDADGRAAMFTFEWASNQ